MNFLIELHHGKFGITHLLYDRTVFSGGEVQVRLKPMVYEGAPVRVWIRAHLTSSDHIMELAMLVDALRRKYGHTLPIYLQCPYLPYARQDRVCAKGEALALKVMCDLINRLEFAGVEVCDVHSDVALALLDGDVRNVSPIPFLDWGHVISKDHTVLVAPDAGALKKVTKIAQHFGVPMVRADKTRDPQTGAITGTTVHSQGIGDRDFLIVDDICDGGRTFIELAKALRPLTSGQVNLYVTHGIFSQGLDPLEEVIDTIYCANHPFPYTEYTGRSIISLADGAPTTPYAESPEE